MQESRSTACRLERDKFKVITAYHFLWLYSCLDLVKWGNNTIFLDYILDKSFRHAAFWHIGPSKGIIIKAPYYVDHGMVRKRNRKLGETVSYTVFWKDLLFVDKGNGFSA